MSDPKEALERLKAWVSLIEHRAPNGDNSLAVDAETADQHAADLSWLIAEREGLEREVERLTWLAQKRFEHKVEASARMEDAESKLSALEEAASKALRQAEFMSGRRSEFEALRALLHPTERDLGETTPCFACGDSRLERWVGYGGAEEVGPCSVCQPQTFPCPICPRWRPEVAAFADLMERELRANDHKPGWKGENPWPLLDRLREELGELWDELQPGSRTNIGAWRGRVGAEAADVANFAMMIADVCGALSVAPPSQGMETEQFAGNAKCPDVSGLVEAVTMAAERLSTQGQSTPLGPTEAIYFGKMRGIAADLFSALAALQSHKGGEGESELAAADNNREADCTTSGGAG
jgi:NTP pyrophosphatase (non-canonical NTP hydrolase)